MYKRTKRITSIAAAIMLAASMMAGCGGSASTATTKAATATTKAAATTAAATTKAAAGTTAAATTKAAAGATTKAAASGTTSAKTVANSGGTKTVVQDPYAQATTDWEKTANIYATKETDDELYKKAQEEGGEITVYSISSRTPKVVESFNAKYPKIKATSFDIDTNQLIEKVTREHEAGQYVCDVAHIKDEDGSKYKEYIANKIFYNYKPADILSHIDATLTATQTPLYIELTQLFYNTEKYPDGSPVKNIWELTDAKWKGKIVMQNPLDNVSWGAWITGFCCGKVPDELAKAYKELYNKDITLSAGCENAGYEFLKRLRANNPVYTASSDEAAQAVGTPGQTDPPIGFSASSKLRKAVDNGWKLNSVNLYPTNGIPAINTLYIVQGCKHPAGAKLFIRFMMGDTDGDLSGYKQFNTLGGWPVRDDIKAAEGSTPLSEMHISPFDPDQIYDNFNKVRDFWQALN